MVSIERYERFGASYIARQMLIMTQALAFRVRMSILTTPKEIVIDWLRGHDVVLWESFCGMLHGKFKTK